MVENTKLWNLIKDFVPDDKKESIINELDNILYEQSERLSINPIKTYVPFNLPRRQSFANLGEAKSFNEKFGKY